MKVTGFIASDFNEWVDEPPHNVFVTIDYAEKKRIENCVHHLCKTAVASGKLIVYPTTNKYINKKAYNLCKTKLYKKTVIQKGGVRTVRADLMNKNVILTVKLHRYTIPASETQESIEGVYVGIESIDIIDVNTEDGIKSILKK